MIFDRGLGGIWYQSLLTASWQVGARLYSALGRFDAFFGVSSWQEAFDWLARHDSQEPIREVQYWGHGNWGSARVSGELLSMETIPHHADALRALADRMGPESLFWFRTCETFGRAVGHDFARAWSDRLGCRVAGHTYVIHLAQSGLHSLALGSSPTWSTDEGLPSSAERPRHALSSRFGYPNTISCFRGDIPEGF